MEIEHKFRLPRQGMLTLRKKMNEIWWKAPLSYQRDTYFLPAEPGYIYRLRGLTPEKGPAKVELTAKTYGGDPEVREEITLPLVNVPGLGGTVEKFMKTMILLWSGTIEKTVNTWRVDDCEVAVYSCYATVDGSDGPWSYFVEVEYMGHAQTAQEQEEARAALAAVEEKLGLAGHERETRSLFDLLLSEHMQTTLRSSEAP